LCLCYGFFDLKPQFTNAEFKYVHNVMGNCMLLNELGITAILSLVIIL
jgi:hypothetical protein